MVTVHVEVKRPVRARRAGCFDGSRTVETGASGVSRAPDTDEASAWWVVLGQWWQRDVCSVPARLLLVASKRRLLQDERTKSSLSTGELVDEGDRTAAGVWSCASSLSRCQYQLSCSKLGHLHLA